MIDAKKILIGFVLMLTIGAGAAFAGWSSSATGSCDHRGHTIYPWNNWTKPEHPGLPGGLPDYNKIEGTFEDDYTIGAYEGEKDSVTVDYCWYSGSWVAAFKPSLLGSRSAPDPTCQGQFWLRVQLNICPTPWNGEWWGTVCTCTGGTMTGVYSVGPIP